MARAGIYQLLNRFLLAFHESHVVLIYEVADGKKKLIFSSLYDPELKRKFLRLKCEEIRNPKEENLARLFGTRRYFAFYRWKNRPGTERDYWAVSPNDEYPSESYNPLIAFKTLFESNDRPLLQKKMRPLIDNFVDASTGASFVNVKRKSRPARFSLSYEAINEDEVRHWIARAQHAVDECIDRCVDPMLVSPAVKPAPNSPSAILLGFRQFDRENVRGTRYHYSTRFYFSQEHRSQLTRELGKSFEKFTVEAGCAGQALRELKVIAKEFLNDSGILGIDDAVINTSVEDFLYPENEGINCGKVFQVLSSPVGENLSTFLDTPISSGVVRVANDVFTERGIVNQIDPEVPLSYADARFVVFLYLLVYFLGGRSKNVSLLVKPTRVNGSNWNATARVYGSCGSDENEGVYGYRERYFFYHSVGLQMARKLRRRALEAYFRLVSDILGELLLPRLKGQAADADKLDNILTSINDVFDVVCRIFPFDRVKIMPVQDQEREHMLMLQLRHAYGIILRLSPNPYFDHIGRYRYISEDRLLNYLRSVESAPRQAWPEHGQF